MNKKVKLWSLIGSFMVGGLVLVSPSVSFADDFTMPPVLPYSIDGVTYTEYTAYQSSNGYCYIQFYNDNTQYVYDSYTGQPTAGTMGETLIAGFGTHKWAISFSGVDSAQYSVACGTGAPYWTGMVLSTPWNSISNNFDSWVLSDGTGMDLYPIFYAGSRDVIRYDTSAVIYSAGTIPDRLSHFISTIPQGGSTVATTSSIGYQLNINHDDYTPGMTVTMAFTQDSSFACANSGAVYDAVYTCSGDNAPAAPFTETIDPQTLLDGYNIYSKEITFPGGGKWTGVYTVKKPYFFGFFHSDLIASTTNFTVGQPSPMDIVRGDIAAAQEAQASTTRHGIGAILASTTASLAASCSPFASFNLGDCIVLLFWPGEQAVADDFDIIKQTPPWGYAFRVIDILKDTTATSTVLPSISYTFATSSPMASMGEIHFDPFGTLAESGALISEMKSDRADSQNVWQILMPFIRTFVYIVLGIMVIHDLTGIHRGESSAGSSTGRRGRINYPSVK